MIELIPAPLAFVFSVYGRDRMHLIWAVDKVRVGYHKLQRLSSFLFIFLMYFARLIGGKKVQSICYRRGGSNESN